MKKLFKSISILVLICFSFFYTDRVINVINMNDPLMEKITDVKNKYEVLPVNAIIDNDTIMPGIKGREIDVDKSYDNMKLSKIFREEALIFKDLYPSNMLKDNKNKYIIGGNSSKKEVSIIYIYNSRYSDEVMKIDNITLFMNHKDLTISNIKNLNDKDIYSYGNGGVYNKEVLVSDNSLINTFANNKSKYCLVREKNEDILKLCNENDMYVVIPTIFNGYYGVKSNLSNGSIILLENLNDIDVIIKYIKSKGYDIVSLSKLLSE